MTIYNSQRVNSDPFPWMNPEGERVSNKTRMGSVYYHSPEDAMRYKRHPRPKYDNNPNPLLEAFRTVSEHPRGGLVALAERVLKNRHGLWDEEINDPSYLEHAHRVLTKLINVYKETS